jgi:hypothetical protein
MDKSEAFRMCDLVRHQPAKFRFFHSIIEECTAVDEDSAAEVPPIPVDGICKTVLNAAINVRTGAGVVVGSYLLAFPKH